MSHKEDVDGLCSAALVKTAFGADSVVLSDYPSLIPKLEKLATGEKITKNRATFNNRATKNRARPLLYSANMLEFYSIFAKFSSKFNFI